MRKAINMILTALSAAILMVWIWKFFGPGSEETRRAGSAALGGIGFTSLNALCLMVFCLLYIPCTATLATIRRESSTKYMFATAAFQLGVAWLVTFLVYQIGMLVV